MKQLFKKASGAVLLFLYIFSVFFGGIHAPVDCVLKYEKCYTPVDLEEKSVEALSKDVEISSRIYELIFGDKKKNSEERMLYPGGAVFGLLIKEDGVSVTAGSNSKVLLAGDRILKINGKEVSDCAEVEDAVKSCGGKKIEAEIIRGGERLTVNVVPKLSDGTYKLGVNLRSHTAGIGTVTFVDPDTLSFGGLGHGVSAADGTGYVTVKSGTVNAVTLGGCKKGEIGHAGELTGVLKQTTLGSISKNTDCGVFGTLDSLPDYCNEAMPVAHNDEVKCGAAQIISTVKNGKRGIFNVEIKDIDYSSSGSKSFKIKVTDPTLIALTGGIVRGMSGSPIIQDGKLIGAVTHVMVANPTEGYGIFIENMLNAVQNQAQPKAA